MIDGDMEGGGNRMASNTGDIIAGFFILGLFLLAIVLAVAAVKEAANRNRTSQAEGPDLKNRIEALEMRVEKLENE